MLKLKKKKTPDSLNSSNSPVPKKLKPKAKDTLLSESEDLAAGDLSLLGKYESARCSYVSPEGTQCKNFACSSGTLCSVHSNQTKAQRLQSMQTDVRYASLPQTYLERTKFDPAVHPLLYIKLSKQGRSDVEIASEFNISVQTLKRWTQEITEMKEAYEIGQTMYEAFFLKKGTENLENDRFNNVLFKYITMNKLGYSDKMETKSTSTGLHGVLLIPGTTSIEDWEKQTLEKEAQERLLDASDAKQIGRQL